MIVGPFYVPKVVGTLTPPPAPPEPNPATSRLFVINTYHLLAWKEDLRVWEAYREWLNEVRHHKLHPITEEKDISMEWEEVKSPLGGLEWMCTVKGMVCDYL